MVSPYLLLPIRSETQAMAEREDAPEPRWPTCKDCGGALRSSFEKMARFCRSCQRERAGNDTGGSRGDSGYE